MGTADEESMRAAADAPALWSANVRRERRGEALGAMLLLAIGLIALTYPRLPAGICFHDPGDLQTAAATLGIAHPPGYAGYASLGYPWTLMPGIDPARGVTLACLAAGIGALLLGAALQIRLGVNPWLAAALSLALALHPRVWINLIVPEVYAPTWLFVMSGAFLLTLHVSNETPARWHAAAAFFCFGFAAANRPPVMLMLPGVLLALWIFWQSGGIPFKLRRRTAWLSAAGFLLPVVYCGGYLWIRDTANQPYNYIEGYYRETDVLPDVDAGAAAKARRIWWLISGGQYQAERDLAVQPLQRLRWIAEQVSAENNLVFIAATIAFAAGVVLVRRRSIAVLVLLLGILLGSAGFLCLYRVYDSAADVLALVGVLTIFAGMALEALLPRADGWRRRGVALGVFALAVFWTIGRVRELPNTAAEYDATAFARSANLASLPREALVLTTWREAAPLGYARLVETGRMDIEVLCLPPERWPARAAEQAARGGAVFVADPVSASPETEIIPAGGLWRWEFHDSIPGAGDLRIEGRLPRMDVSCFPGHPNRKVGRNSKFKMQNSKGRRVGGTTFLNFAF